MPNQEKFVIIYDENDIYFTDKKSYLKDVIIPKDTKEMEFDTEEEMLKTLNSDLFEEYFD